MENKEKRALCTQDECLNKGMDTAAEKQGIRAVVFKWAKKKGGGVGDFSELWDSSCAEQHGPYVNQI